MPIPKGFVPMSDIQGDPQSVPAIKPPKGFVPYVPPTSTETPQPSGDTYSYPAGRLGAGKPPQLGPEQLTEEFKALTPYGKVLATSGGSFSPLYIGTKMASGLGAEAQNIAGMPWALAGKQPPAIFDPMKTMPFYKTAKQVEAFNLDRARATGKFSLAPAAEMITGIVPVLMGLAASEEFVPELETPNLVRKMATAGEMLKNAGVPASIASKTVAIANPANLIRLAKTGVVTFAISSGTTKERAESAKNLMAYQIAPMVSHGLGLYGGKAFIANLIGNAMVSRPQYDKLIEKYGGLDKAMSDPNFYSELVPQAAMDVYFATNIHGRLESAIRMKIDYARAKYKMGEGGKGLDETQFRDLLKDAGDVRFNAKGEVEGFRKVSQDLTKEEYETLQEAMGKQEKKIELSPEEQRVFDKSTTPKEETHPFRAGSMLDLPTGKYVYFGKGANGKHQLVDYVAESGPTGNWSKGNIDQIMKDVKPATYTNERMLTKTQETDELLALNGLNREQFAKIRKVYPGRGPLEEAPREVQAQVLKIAKEHPDSPPEKQTEFINQWLKSSGEVKKVHLAEGKGDAHSDKVWNSVYGLLTVKDMSHLMGQNGWHGKDLTYADASSNLGDQLAPSGREDRLRNLSENMDALMKEGAERQSLNEFAKHNLDFPPKDPEGQKHWKDELYQKLKAKVISPLAQFKLVSRDPNAMVKEGRGEFEVISLDDRVEIKKSLMSTLKVDKSNETITYNPKYVDNLWDLYTQGKKYLPGGSKVIPLPKGLTRDEFRTWAIEHERVHLITGIDDSDVDENMTNALALIAINKPLEAEQLRQKAMQAHPDDGSTLGINKSDKISRMFSAKKEEDKPMYYKMGANENLTGKDTSTLELAEQGLRTSTTRSQPLGKVGDVVTFEGRPTKYRITGTHKITAEDMANPEFIRKLSQTEQWTEDTIKTRHKFQIKPGAVVTNYERVSEIAPVAPKQAIPEGVVMFREGGMIGRETQPFETEPHRPLKSAAWQADIRNRWNLRPKGRRDETTVEEAGLRGERKKSEINILDSVGVESIKSILSSKFVEKGPEFKEGYFSKEEQYREDISQGVKIREAHDVLSRQRWVSSQRVEASKWGTWEAFKAMAASHDLQALRYIEGGKEYFDTGRMEQYESVIEYPRDVLEKNIGFDPSEYGTYIVFDPQKEAEHIAEREAAIANFKKADPKSSEELAEIVDKQSRGRFPAMEEKEPVGEGFAGDYGWDPKLIEKLQKEFKDLPPVYQEAFKLFAGVGNRAMNEDEIADKLKLPVDQVKEIIQKVKDIISGRLGKDADLQYKLWDAHKTDVIEKLDKEGIIQGDEKYFNARNTSAVVSRFGDDLTLINELIKSCEEQLKGLARLPMAERGRLAAPIQRQLAQLKTAKINIEREVMKQPINLQESVIRRMEKLAKERAEEKKKGTIERPIGSDPSYMWGIMRHIKDRVATAPSEDLWKWDLRLFAIRVANKMGFHDLVEQLVTKEGSHDKAMEEIMEQARALKAASSTALHDASWVKISSWSKGRTLGEYVGNEFQDAVLLHVYNIVDKDPLIRSWWDKPGMSEGMKSVARVHAGMEVRKILPRILEELHINIKDIEAGNTQYSLSDVGRGIAAVRDAESRALDGNGNQILGMSNGFAKEYNDFAKLWKGANHPDFDPVTGLMTKRPEGAFLNLVPKSIVDLAVWMKTKQTERLYEMVKAGVFDEKDMYSSVARGYSHKEYQLKPGETEIRGERKRPGRAQLKGDENFELTSKSSDFSDFVWRAGRANLKPIEDGAVTEAKYQEDSYNKLGFIVMLQGLAELNHPEDKDYAAVSYIGKWYKDGKIVPQNTKDAKQFTYDILNKLHMEEMKNAPDLRSKRGDLWEPPYVHSSLAKIINNLYSNDHNSSLKGWNSLNGWFKRYVMYTPVLHSFQLRTAIALTSKNPIGNVAKTFATLLPLPYVEYFDKVDSKAGKAYNEIAKQSIWGGPKFAKMIREKGMNFTTYHTQQYTNDHDDLLLAAKVGLPFINQKRAYRTLYDSTQKLHGLDQTRAQENLDFIMNEGDMSRQAFEGSAGAMTFRAWQAITDDFMAKHAEKKNPISREQAGTLAAKFLSDVVGIYDTGVYGPEGPIHQAIWFARDWTVSEIRQLTGFIVDPAAHKKLAAGGEWGRIPVLSRFLNPIFHTNATSAEMRELRPLYGKQIAKQFMARLIWVGIIQAALGQGSNFNNDSGKKFYAKLGHNGPDGREAYLDMLFHRGPVQWMALSPTQILGEHDPLKGWSPGFIKQYRSKLGIWARMVAGLITGVNSMGTTVVPTNEALPMAYKVKTMMDFVSNSLNPLPLRTDVYESPSDIAMQTFTPFRQIYGIQKGSQTNISSEKYKKLSNAAAIMKAQQQNLQALKRRYPSDDPMWKKVVTKGLYPGVGRMSYAQFRDMVRKEKRPYTELRKRLQGAVRKQADQEKDTGSLF